MENEVATGDRVKITLLNGDVAEVTVTDATEEHLLSEYATWGTGVIAEMEIISRTVPTEDGLYSDRDGTVWGLYEGYVTKFLEGGLDEYYAPYTRVGDIEMYPVPEVSPPENLGNP